MTLIVVGFIVIFLLVLMSGFPVGFGLGFLAIGMLTLTRSLDMALTVAIEKAYTTLDSEVLVAIPLFIFVAQLISATGMGKRMFDSAKVFLGFFKAGLGVGTILSSGLFAAMTGSSFVSASTMGMIAIPELRKAKYSDTIISSAITAGGSLGSVIPPSIVMILYGFLTDESIGKLFMAGVIPGLLMIVLYSFALVLLIGFSTPKEVKTTLAQMSGSSDAVLMEEESLTKIQAFKEAFWAFMAPVIILGGIYLGIFTTNEAAAVAVIYCIILGLFVYKSLDLKALFSAMMSAASTSAMVTIVVIGGAMLGQVIVDGRIPQLVIELIIAKDFSPYVLLLFINIILFGLGMFMEVLALIYLSVPLLYPLVLHMGWDNIWFAVIIMINFNLALITPPMGGVLYIVAQVGNIPFPTVVKGALLPIVVLLLVLILVVLYPPIATWIPSLM